MAMPTMSMGVGSAPLTPSRNLEAMSVAELEEELSLKDRAIHDLQTEIARLQRTPQVFEERLEKLERTFSHFGPNDTLKIRSPLLMNIAKSMEVEKARLHNEAIEEHGRRWTHMLREGEAVAHNPHTHHSHEDFVMGRRAMQLDPIAAAQAKEVWTYGAHNHPVVTRMHYAGHCIRPTEEIAPVYVGPGGVENRRPFNEHSEGVQPSHGEFWLDAIVRDRDQEDGFGVPQAVLDAEERRRKPQSAFARDRPGLGEDCLPKDWLGEARRRGVEVVES